jgi:hypothetical protein
MLWCVDGSDADALTHAVIAELRSPSATNEDIVTTVASRADRDARTFDERGSPPTTLRASPAEGPARP